MKLRAPVSAGSRSKAVATWLALVGGSLGLHRFYLYGPGDPWAWLHPWPTLAGAWGLWRLREFGSEDVLGSVLVPLLGAMLAATMLAAIVLGLTPAERWDAQFASGPARARSSWLVIGGVVVALAVGATTLMATIAFSAQRYFEWTALAGPSRAVADRSGSPAAGPVRLSPWPDRKGVRFA